MTEEILINGVNVKECEHYLNTDKLDYNCNETPKSVYCKNNPNCYFKQLVREKQRADDNQKLANELEKVIQEGTNMIIELKQKNEELEEKLIALQLQDDEKVVYEVPEAYVEQFDKQEV